jgi:hypothetical protein
MKVASTKANGRHLRRPCRRCRRGYWRVPDPVVSLGFNSHCPSRPALDAVRHSAIVAKPQLTAPDVFSVKQKRSSADTFGADLGCG